MTEEAFIQAYEAHSDAIFRFALFRLGDRELAQDVMQQTFMKTWTAVQKGKAIDTLKPFLFTVCKRLIIDHYRKKKSVSLDQLMDQGFDPGQEHDDKWAQHIDTKEQLKVLNDLKPPSYQEVIWLRYVEDLSVKHIATTLGVKENVISVRLNRALKKLRNLMAHAG